MASQLSAILTHDELSSLSNVLKEKIDDCLNKKETDLSKTKIEFAKFQTESDQKFYNLDAELKQFQELKQKEEDEKNEIVQQKTKIESKFNEISEELGTLQQKIAMLEETNSGLKREKETWMTERDDFVSLLSRKNDDVDRLTTELKSLTDQLMNANREKSEVMIKTEELNSKQLALDYKEKRLEQERELMVKQLKVLQDELDAKTKDIVVMRREKTSKVLELQADLTEKIEELKMSQRSIEDMRTTIEQQDKQIKELTGKVKDLNDAEHKMTENARNELRSQMRLCELYKSSSEDAQCKADELTKAVEELQRLLRDASVRYGELETETKSEIDLLKVQLKKRDEAIDELKKELDRANGLLDTSKGRLLTEESIEAMSPSAAAASRLLKSGMTLTQIYSQYITVSEQLLVKDEENRKLNNYIDQILQEIEERAPIISRQREDYEKSLEMVSNLTRQLDLAIEECEKEKSDALEARRLLGQSQRTNQRLDKQVTDLSKQVAFLLREVEELRGNKMADGPGDNQVVSSTGEDGSAGAIISRHLVTFKDVEELQHRNQMLLNTLREVTEKQEEAEKEVLSEKTAKIEEALEKALMEVENMREARRRQEELVQSIVQQRDMYRIMVQDAGLNESRSPSKFSSAALTSSTPAAQRIADRSSIADTTDHNEYKIRLESAETNYKTLVAEKKELERNLNEKIQKLQDSLADVRAQNVRLGTQIEYSNDKEKLLVGNIEGFKKQINVLEDKNKMYACTVAKHEQSIAVLRDEAMSAQQQLARSEVTVSLLQQEKELLKSAEQRLLIERDSLLAEKRSQSLLHVNLESIKLNLERNDCETRTRLQNTVTSLEQQIELLRKKLDGEEQRYKETVKSFEERLEQERSLLSKSEEKIKELEEKLSNQTTSGSVIQMTDDETVKSLRNQLIESRTELNTLKNHLELSKKQSSQYKEIADRIEEELKRNNEASVMFREEAERKVKELNEENENLLKKLEEADEKFKKLEEASQKVDQIEELTKKVSSLEAEIERLAAQAKSAEESEQRARFDYFEQSKLAKEAQDRYERELVQHAADIEQLNRNREQLESATKQLNELQQSRAKVEQELESGKTSWTNQKEMLEKELKEKSDRCSELEKQVDLTQQQIVSLSTRMAALTKVHETPVKSDDLNVSVEEERTSDQLLELVRFLRREKEIAISRSEVQEAENQRLKTQLDIAEKQLNEAQKHLDVERERLATSTLTFEKHTDMLRRLETLNALTDSNRLLREEKVNLTAKHDELTAKCQNLESELEPLRNASRETGARVDELTNENVALRKQLMMWKSRATALQERAGNASETKRLQTEKENLQRQVEMLNKQIEANKETISKLTSQVADAGKLHDENAKCKEEIEKLRGAFKDADTKKAEESAKSIEQANQLRRIARKYKTQYEEVKAEFDKLKETAPKAEEPADTKEFEQKITELTAEIETIKTENATLKANDEKTKNILKTLRQKLAAFNALSKEKESLTAELTEAKAKIESLEQGNEEVNVRSAALKSQLEGKLNRLERENGELVQAKQSLAAEVESLNQKIAITQRQLDVYQKTVAPVKAATPEVETVKPTETPTAEIKPMAGQSRTTPTASIRPMAATRTAAVQPMAVVVAVREEEQPAPAATATPTPEVAAPEEVEPVAGPSSATPGGEVRQQKRTREEEDEDEGVKRTRVTEEEEGEVLELMAPEETEEEAGEEFEEGQHEGDDEDEEAAVEEIEAEDAENVENEPMNEEEGEVVEVIEEETSESLADDEQQQQQQQADETREEPVVEEVEDQQPPPAEEEPEVAPHEVPEEPAPVPTPAALLPPPREERLLPIPARPTIAYDDGGDDGIVPSTPVLLPPRANDGFAEAVSSPQVNTRFVFGTAMVEPLTTSHLESQGMEDTRMDLSQLEENRALPPQPVAEETPAAPSTDEPADLEGGPDLESDAAAEMDLLREDESAQVDTQETQQEPRVEPEVAVQQPPVPVQQTQSPRGGVGGTARRASPRGVRGMLNRPPSRPVPITWTPTAQPTTVRENPRVFRRAATASPAGPAAGLLPDPIVGGTPSPVRGRGAAAGRGRARRAARRP